MSSLVAQTGDGSIKGISREIESTSSDHYNSNVMPQENYDKPCGCGCKGGLSPDAL